MTTWLLDPGALAERLTGFVEAPGFAPVALVVAFVAGAAHAVQPGHGKTLAAAYLVGSQGRVRDAAYLGGSVAVMHTVSALVIALAWTFLSLSEHVSLDRLTGSLSVVAGLVVVLLGLWMLRGWWRRGHGHAHAHAHAHGHSHGHGHGHSHGHSHSHGADRPGLWLLGISGGLVPSPAAFLLLVTGIFSGRSAFALLLVVVFGAGMALVLFGVGLAAVWGRSFVVRGLGSQDWLRRASRVGPLLASVGVTLGGCVLTAMAVNNLMAV